PDATLRQSVLTGQGAWPARRQRRPNSTGGKMRRLHVLLLAVLACALVVVPSAQAARVQTKAVAQDKAAVARYWTPQRMRNATPADKFVSGRVPAAFKKKKALAGNAVQVPPPYTSQPTS